MTNYAAMALTMNDFLLARGMGETHPENEMEKRKQINRYKCEQHSRKVIMYHFGRCRCLHRLHRRSMDPHEITAEWVTGRTYKLHNIKQ